MPAELVLARLVPGEREPIRPVVLARSVVPARLAVRVLALPGAPVPVRGWERAQQALTKRPGLRAFRQKR